MELWGTHKHIMLDRHCALFAVSIQLAADNERQRERQTQVTFGSIMNDAVAVRQEPLTTWRAVYFARTVGVFSDNETASSNPGQPRLYPR